VQDQAEERRRWGAVLRVSEQTVLGRGDRGPGRPVEQIARVLHVVAVAGDAGEVHGH